MSFPLVGSGNRGVGPNQITSLSLLSFSILLFLCIFSSGKAILLVFRLSSERVAVYVVVALICQWAEVSSGFSCSGILTGISPISVLDLFFSLSCQRRYFFTVLLFTTLQTVVICPATLDNLVLRVEGMDILWCAGAALVLGRQCTPCSQEFQGLLLSDPILFPVGNL